MLLVALQYWAILGNIAQNISNPRLWFQIWKIFFQFRKYHLNEFQCHNLLSLSNFYQIEMILHHTLLYRCFRFKENVLTCFLFNFSCWLSQAEAAKTKMHKIVIAKITSMITGHLTNATNVIIDHIRQVIWGDVWKHKVEKNQTWNQCDSVFSWEILFEDSF